MILIINEIYLNLGNLYNKNYVHINDDINILNLKDFY